MPLIYNCSCYEMLETLELLDGIIDIMDQYHPCGDAAGYPPIDRPLIATEYQQALEFADRAGITRLDKRDFSDLLQRLYLIHGK